MDDASGRCAAGPRPSLIASAACVGHGTACHPKRDHTARPLRPLYHDESASAADALPRIRCMHALELNAGVEVVFGYPGGAILPVYDAIHESPHFKFILPRREDGGGHMAEGYARVTGKPGVVLVTSGPGGWYPSPLPMRYHPQQYTKLLLTSCPSSTVTYTAVASLPPCSHERDHADGGRAA